MKDPYARESCPEALASRKVAHREMYTEGSETANLGSNEQELDIEAVKVGLGSTTYQRPKGRKLPSAFAVDPVELREGICSYLGRSRTVRDTD